MALTKAQEALLRKLENGSVVTFKDGHYVVVKHPETDEKIWPSTFYGLYDAGLVEKLSTGNYTISNDGIRQIRSKNK